MMGQHGVTFGKKKERVVWEGGQNGGLMCDLIVKNKAGTFCHVGSLSHSRLAEPLTNTDRQVLKAGPMETAHYKSHILVGWFHQFII